MGGKDYIIMQTLKTFLEHHIGIDEKEWFLLEKQLYLKSYKKGEFISLPDDIWTDVLYINKGIIRSYIINQQGKDFTRQFYFNTDESNVSNLFVLDLTSLIKQIPSNRGFEALTDTELICFSRSDLYHLYDTYEKWSYIGRKMAELAYIDMDNLYYSILTQTPKERYLELQRSMSTLLNQIPQYYIASYLGISPVSLSRIRQKL